MKKSTLLSLATAGAIVATSAFTFAAWDQVSDTTQAVSLKFTAPKIVDVNTDLSFATTELNGKTSETTSQMKFDISGTKSGDKIKLSLVDTSGNALSIPDGLDVTFTKGAAASSSDLVTTAGVAEDDSFTDGADNEYGVKVKVNSEITPTQAKALSESGFSVKVKAEIVSTPAS